MSHHDSHEHDSSEGTHHILSSKVTRRTLVALLILTIVTVAAAQIDLGTSLNFALAMLIATVKAMVVTLIFMGLKYDTVDNRIYFYSSAFFISVFILLTASDIFTRPDGWRVGDQDVFMATAAVGGPDFKRPWESDEKLLAHGKKLYEINCAVCHGAEGLGNGPGSGLPIKPRNLTVAEGWKNERRPSDIYKMLEVGIAPYMPAYAQLSIGDRWALTHFVLDIGPDPVADTESTLAAVGINPALEDGGIGGGPVKKTIPIDYAIERYLQKAN
jgi:caa(3)-type oxidase subunit IV